MGQTTNLGPLGAPMSTSLELGPECDANGLGQQQHDWRKTMVSRKCCSEMENAWKPCCRSPGSLFKQRGGRAPPSMWPNWAVPQTTTVETLSCLLQFTQGSDGAPPSQIATRHGSRLRGNFMGITSTKPRKQTKPSWM